MTSIANEIFKTIKNKQQNGIDAGEILESLCNNLLENMEPNVPFTIPTEYYVQTGILELKEQKKIKKVPDSYPTRWVAI